jgi:hypothetical protein
MKETILMIPSRSSATGTPLHPHRHTSYSSRVQQQLGEESAPGRVSDHVRRPREQHGEGLEQGDLKSIPSYLMEYEILSLLRKICLKRFLCDGLRRKEGRGRGGEQGEERSERREGREGGGGQTWRSQQSIGARKVFRYSSKEKIPRGARSTVDTFAGEQ